MSLSSSEEMRRREQENLPMIHFYQEFVNKNSNNRHHNNGRRRQQRHHQQHWHSSSTTTTRSRSSDSRMMESIIRVSSEQLPVSPLTPTTEEKGPPPFRNPGNTTTKEPTKTTTRKLTLYERSQIRLKEREKKVQRIKEEMMRECTFRPSVGRKAHNSNSNNNKKTPNRSKSAAATRNKARTQQLKNPIIMSNSTPTASTETTTPSTSTTMMTSPTTTTSSTRQYWQDLQRRQQQQEKLQRQEQHRHHHASTTSTLSKEDGSKTVSTTKSLRFEELYQDGLRRARLRPATEKMEQELRKQRQEEREMKECTFKPKLYWGQKLAAGKLRRTGVIAAASTPSKGTNDPASGSTRRVSNTCTVRGGGAGAGPGHRSLSPRRKMTFESISPRRRKVFESLSPRRKLFGSLSPRRKLFEPAPRHLGPMPHSFRSRQQKEQQQQQPKKDPIPDIALSPIPVKEEEESCGSLSLLRRHHDIMRERNQRADSPIPPLPLEIITTGVRPVSPVEKRPWRASYLYARDSSISPLRGRALGIEIDSEYVERTTNNAATKSAPRVIFDGTTIGGESVAVQSQVTEYGSI